MCLIELGLSMSACNLQWALLQQHYDRLSLRPIAKKIQLKNMDLKFPIVLNLPISKRAVKGFEWSDERWAPFVKHFDAWNCTICRVNKTLSSAPFPQKHNRARWRHGRRSSSAIPIYVRWAVGNLMRDDAVIPVYSHCGVARMSRNLCDCRTSQGLSALLLERWTGNSRRVAFSPFHITSI